MRLFGDDLSPCWGLGEHGWFVASLLYWWFDGCCWWLGWCQKYWALWWWLVEKCDQCWRLPDRLGWNLLMNYYEKLTRVSRIGWTVVVSVLEAERRWLIGCILISLVYWWLLMVVKVAKLLGVMVVVGGEMRSLMEFT